MQLLYLFCLFSFSNFFKNLSYGFNINLPTNKVLRSSHRTIKMLVDPNIHTIQEIKFYFDKENVVDFIRDINEEKLEDCSSLNQIYTDCMLYKTTCILCWSDEEAAQYILTFKQQENKTDT